MSVSPALGSPPSAEGQAEQGNVRAEQTPTPAETFPPSGGDSAEETSPTQSAAGAAARGQDEVKLQWEPPNETAVYQFVDQQGSLIVQVPSMQELNQAREIAQELAEESAPKQAPAVDGGKDHER
jgi:hypothetical protein